VENLIPKPGQNHAMDWVTILLLAIIFTCFALLRSAIPFRCGVEGQDDDLTTGKPEVCVICLEDVTSEDPCRQLPCCGVVHTYCLLEKEKTYRQEKGILQFPCPKCQLQTLQTAFCPELERTHCDFVVTSGKLESEWIYNVRPPSYKLVYKPQ
jgi:hypothetical protein